MVKKELADLVKNNLFLVEWFDSNIKVNNIPGGYSKQYLRLLIHISFLGRTNLKNLSRSNETSTSNLCAILRKMEQDGFIMNKRDDEDRRNVWYSLTSAGKVFAKEVLGAFVAAVSEIFGGLDKEREARLIQALRTVNGLLEEIKEQSYTR